MNPHIVRLAASASLCVLATAAFAQGPARYSPVRRGAEQAQGDTLSMSCAQAAGLIQSHGATVLTSGPNVFDRYVRTDVSCYRNDENQSPAFVPTRDNPQCFIGYTCSPTTSANR